MREREERASTPSQLTQWLQITEQLLFKANPSINLRLFITVMSQCHGFLPQCRASGQRKCLNLPLNNDFLYTCFYGNNDRHMITASDMVRRAYSVTPKVNNVKAFTLHYGMLLEIKLVQNSSLCWIKCYSLSVRAV